MNLISSFCSWAICPSGLWIVPSFITIWKDLLSCSNIDCLLFFFLDSSKDWPSFCLRAAPDLGSDDIYGVWRIDDTDHSFSTQPFRIRYARQDILLAMMVSFNLSLSKLEVNVLLFYVAWMHNTYNSCVQFLSRHINFPQSWNKLRKIKWLS